MNEIIQLITGIALLLLGFPLGVLLAKFTKDEKREGQKWFKRIILLSLVGGLISLVVKNDTLLFSFFFIAIVTSRSLRR